MSHLPTHPTLVIRGSCSPETGGHVGPPVLALTLPALWGGAVLRCLGGGRVSPFGASRLGRPTHKPTDENRSHHGQGGWEVIHFKLLGGTERSGVELTI